VRRNTCFFRATLRQKQPIFDPKIGAKMVFLRALKISLAKSKNLAQCCGHEAILLRNPL